MGIGGLSVISPKFILHLYDKYPGRIIVLNYALEVIANRLTEYSFII